MYIYGMRFSANRGGWFAHSPTGARWGPQLCVLCTAALRCGTNDNKMFKSCSLLLLDIAITAYTSQPCNSKYVCDAFRFASAAPLQLA
jgi:hypothetical protein